MQWEETSRVTVGEDRIRKVLPRVEELARSIEERGQLQPIVVRASDWRLLAGARRLAACKMLKRKTLVRLVATADEALEALRCEGAEQLERVDWTAEERVRYAQRLLELEEQAAAERRAAGAAEGGRRKAAAANGTPVPEAAGGDEEGRAKNRVAKAVGFGGRRSLEAAMRVVEAADADPKLAPLVDELNKTGKATAVAAKLDRAQAAGGLHDKDSWCTQEWILAGVHAAEPDGIALDPCSNELARALGFVAARVSWTIDNDARLQPTWRVPEAELLGRRYVVWYQPPYSCPDEADKDLGAPGLTTKLVEQWDAEAFDRVYALVKNDPSTRWWAKLRERAAFLVLPHERLAHVAGQREDGEAIEVRGSDFSSAMFVLAKGTRSELLDLGNELAKAYEGRADVWTSRWVLEQGEEGPGRKQPGRDPGAVVWPEDGPGSKD